MWLSAFIIFVHCVVALWLYKSQDEDELRKEKKWRERYEWRE